MPPTVLQEAAENLVDFHGEGMSIVEMSHRGKVYDRVHRRALDHCRRLYGVPEDFEILFLQGGASTQFAMVPLNLLRPGRSADYINTGGWSKKAIAELGILGKDWRLAGSGEVGNFRQIPPFAGLQFDGEAEYVHLTSNNTLYGTQFATFPDTKGVPLVADMSSDLLSRPLDWQGVGLVYGGAQKNAGVAGLTLVIVRRDLVGRAPAQVPTMLRYSTYADSDSLYNTPPVFSIYAFSLVLQWIENQGGLVAIENHNRGKAALVYEAIDGSAGFYRGHACRDSRSLMNITFNLADAELERRFCAEAEAAGFSGLKGHRSVGGVRASVYNAMPREGCEALAAFMGDFAAQHG